MFRFVITCFISITIYIGSKGGGNAHGSNTFDVETNRQKCNGEEQMKCWSGQCVSITVKCNGIKDCEDGSDEQSSLCETMLCGDKQFQCHYGACIPIEAKCNGTQECWDGTDENEKLCRYEIDITSIQTTVGTITRDTTILPPTKIATKWPQTVGNQYNISTTTILPPNKVTTKRQQTVFNRYKTHATTTTKPIKECVLRNCDYPLFCKISIPGSRNSNAIHYQRRLSLIEGSQVIFNCAEGYYLVGANRLTCTPRGWSHSSPSCKPYCDADFIHNCRPPLKCLFEQPNSRSKIFITKEFTQRVREHSQISFACDEGYLLEGPTMRKCTARGWSNEIPRCVNHCDISDLGNPSSPLKYNVFDSNIQSLEGYQYSTWNKMIKESSYFEFTCEDGYKLDGENRSTCMNNGWSSAAPTCTPLCDLSLVSPCTAPLLCRHNHKTSFLNFGNRADVVLPGVHVDYSCEDGYELDGAMFITCTNNGWSNRIPTCKETVCDVSIFADCTYPLKCKIYDRTLRKYKSIYRRDIPELSNNENLYVNCEDGYTLQGSQYLACRGRK